MIVVKIILSTRNYYCTHTDSSIAAVVYNVNDKEEMINGMIVHYNHSFSGVTYTADQLYQDKFFSKYLNAEEFKTSSSAVKITFLCSDKKYEDWEKAYQAVFKNNDDYEITQKNCSSAVNYLLHFLYSDVEILKKRWQKESCYAYLYCLCCIGCCGLSLFPLPEEYDSPKKVFAAAEKYGQQPYEPEKKEDKHLKLA